MQITEADSQPILTIPTLGYAMHIALACLVVISCPSTRIWLTCCTVLCTRMTCRSTWKYFWMQRIAHTPQKHCLLRKENKATFDPYFWRVYFTCSAIRSKKVLPDLTSSKLFAFSRPIEVPRPPFNLKTAVLESSSWRKDPLVISLWLTSQVFERKYSLENWFCLSWVESSVSCLFLSTLQTSARRSLW